MGIGERLSRICLQNGVDQNGGGKVKTGGLDKKREVMGGGRCNRMGGNRRA